MDFNERLVVDFPKGGFRYQRQTTKVPKRLKEADIDRVRTPLIALLAGDPKYTVSVVNQILNKITDTFFILTVNANLLAVSIYHLKMTGFFKVINDKVFYNEDFTFKEENYTMEAMKKNLDYIRGTKQYANIKSNKYEKYAIRTIANIFRYQRFLERYFSTY